jgi:thiol-disulfide isomerase/thioredoxin
MFTCILAALMVGVLDRPFADLTYEAALAKAKEQEKLLLVDFTATWCGPCKKMDADTWRNAEVGAWLAEHAVAIQVDVDEQKDLAQQFKVNAMPTVVARAARTPARRTCSCAPEAPGPKRPSSRLATRLTAMPSAAALPSPAASR